MAPAERVHRADALHLDRLGRLHAATWRSALDPLSAVMILVVTGIGSLIHIYSTAYMHDEVDSEFARYFSYLNLFAAFMLVLVLGSNFPVMFVGWEGVGLCSYLLIGFWFKKKSAPTPARRRSSSTASATTRSSSGCCALFAQFGTLDFQGDRRGAWRRCRPRPTFGIAVDRDAAALHRRHRQVGADSALHLAAGRDGRPDAGVRADPRGDDGDGRRLHDRPQRRAVQPRAGDDD